MTAAHHPWILTAPWYRWSRPDAPAAGRDSAPALQAFAAPTFIAEFLREPQRSLIDRDEDHPTGLRKLFRPEHRRFYVVACELHCDVPGLPGVPREQVCEAGFEVLAADTERPLHPQKSTEQDHRLYPLVAPPDARTHSARGRTLFFGAVPTGALAASQRLVIHCYVRRHRAGCPRTSTTPDCHGELVWSRPSEPFRVAAAGDSAGLAHDPALARIALNRDAWPDELRNPLGITKLSDAAREILTDGPRPLEYHTPKAPPA